MSQFQRAAGVRAEGRPGGEAVCRVKAFLLRDLGQRVRGLGRGVLQTTAGDRDQTLGSEGVHTVQGKVKSTSDAAMFQQPAGPFRSVSLRVFGLQEL